MHVAAVSAAYAGVVDPEYARQRRVNPRRIDRCNRVRGDPAMTKGSSTTIRSIAARSTPQATMAPPSIEGTACPDTKNVPSWW
ncbi:hypothetical protein GCM10027614_14160 [Micromonospora vulcania]